MPTFNEMIDETSFKLSGYAMRQDRSTHLTEAVNSSDKTLPVASVSNISKGLIEIDDEMMWVDSFDQVSKTLVVAPYGRGYFGSTASSHSANSKVSIAPAYPRAAIKNAINDTILGVSNTLFGVKTISFRWNPAIVAYSIPNEARDIISISYKDVGPTREWYPVRRWRIDKMANVSAFDSNVSLSIYDAIPTTSTLQIAYTVYPQPMSSGGDDFEATTNLAATAKDLIVLGAQYRLLSDIDPGRLTFSSAEADSQTGRIQYGSGGSTAKYIYALYQQRLQEEIERLRDAYPARVHYTR